MDFNLNLLSNGDAMVGLNNGEIGYGNSVVVSGCVANFGSIENYGAIEITAGGQLYNASAFTNYGSITVAGDG